MDQTWTPKMLTAEQLREPDVWITIPINVVEKLNPRTIRWITGYATGRRSSLEGMEIRVAAYRVPEIQSMCEDDLSLEGKQGRSQA